MTNEEISKALLLLRPSARWVLVGDTIAGLEWRDEVLLCPTDEEIAAKIEELGT